MEIEFLNPKNINLYKDKIKNISNDNELINFITEIFPNWIEFMIDDYSEDYPTLKINWGKICDRYQIKRKKIIIVKYIPSIDSKVCSLCKDFCDILTLNGYVIRQIEQFTKCKKCSKAIPNIELYNLLKMNNFECPIEWGENCSNC
jgi:hypothetical protein